MLLISPVLLQQMIALGEASIDVAARSLLSHNVPTVYIFREKKQNLLRDGGVWNFLSTQMFIKDLKYLMFLLGR